MNEVEETLRVINAQIGYHKRNIIALEEYRDKIMKKYNIKEVE